jgi:hypothetical protein
MACCWPWIRFSRRRCPLISPACCSTPSNVEYSLQQLAGDLRPDQRDAGHFVDGIAHQGLEVHDLIRPHPPVLGQRSRIVDLVLAQIEQSHPIRDQLATILVAGHQTAFPVAAVDLASQAWRSRRPLRIRSTPGSGTPMASSIWRIFGICDRRSAGISSRSALYCSYISCRNVSPGASNTQNR